MPDLVRERLASWRRIPGEERVGEACERGRKTKTHEKGVVVGERRPSFVFARRLLGEKWRAHE